MMHQVLTRMYKQPTRSEDLKESLKLFEKDFRIDHQELQINLQSSFSYDEVFQRVLYIVEDLIARDFNMLVNTLYRIDVSESKLKEALASTKESPSKVITAMIIARELKKVETRRKYS